MVLWKYGYWRDGSSMVPSSVTNLANGLFLLDSIFFYLDWWSLEYLRDMRVREPGKSNYCSDWSECIRLFGSFVLIADLMTRCLDWFGYLRWCALLFPKIVWKWIVDCMAHFGDKGSSSLMLTFRQLTIWAQIWSCGLVWTDWDRSVLLSLMVVICWMDMRALVNSGEIVEQLHNC